MKVINVENLRKTYLKGKVLAIDDVSLSVNDGDVFVLTGPDGAGKSSLLKSIVGVLKFDSGTIKVFGFDVNKDAEKVKGKIAFMPQGLGSNLYGKLTIEENIDFFAGLFAVPKNVLRKRKRLLLSATNLLPFKDRQASKLSGGMLQKLGICCSLIHVPKLIVLDEPTTGIDPVSREEIWKLIYRFSKEDKATVIVSTSYLDEAEMGTKVAIMKSAKIIDSFSPDELDRKKFHAFEVFGKDVGKAYAVASKLFKVARMKGNTLRFVSDSNDVKSHFKGLDVSLIEVPLSVEDIFLMHIGLRKLNLSFKMKPSLSDRTVVVNHLTKKFGKFTAVDDCSFNVKSGEIFGLLGPNGAGKTTLIKSILGLYKPTSGYALVSGKRSGKDVKSLIGYMSQRFSLYETMTVHENIVLWGEIYGVSLDMIRKRVDVLAPILGLSNFEGVLVRDLPLGIKQRLSLLCAIIHEPSILFLDEPTSGVDPSERDVFWQVIRYLSKDIGITTLVTTHYMDEAEYCDRVMLMNHARTIAIGTPHELKKKLEDLVGKAYMILSNNTIGDMAKLSDAGFKVKPYGRFIKIYSKRKVSADDLRNLGIEVLSIKEVPITMQDVFVYYVGKDVPKG